MSTENSKSSSQTRSVHSLQVYTLWYNALWMKYPSINPTHIVQIPTENGLKAAAKCWNGKPALENCFVTIEMVTLESWDDKNSLHIAKQNQTAKEKINCICVPCFIIQTHCISALHARIPLLASHIWRQQEKKQKKT